MDRTGTPSGKTGPESANAIAAPNPGYPAWGDSRAPDGREPDKCSICDAAPWRIGCYYRWDTPTFFCLPCLVHATEGLPSVALFHVRQDRERRILFGGLGPLLQWLFDDPVLAADDELHRQIGRALDDEGL